MTITMVDLIIALLSFSLGYYIRWKQESIRLKNKKENDDYMALMGEVNKL